MHFVLLNQFYPPEVLPTGVMLEAVAEALVGRGHQVTVVCGGGAGGQPGVRQGTKDAVGTGQGAGGVAPRVETSSGAPRGGVRVVRVRALSWGRKSAAGKLLAYASYYAGVAWQLFRMRPKPGVIVALTSPPYLSLLARVAAWWHGGRHAHWVMDLYPDVMVAHGMLRKGGWPDRLLGALARWGVGGKRGGPVMALGPDMAERLRCYIPAGNTVEWVSLWGTAGGVAGDGAVAALRDQRGWAAEETVFLYSGNMGLGHRFADVMAAAPALSAALPDRKLRLAFFGEGKRKEEVEQRIRHGEAGKGPAGEAGEIPPGLPATPGTLRMEVQGYVPQEELAVHLASGDVHLASLEPAWDGMMVPSKLPGIFAAGRPVLFTGSRTCSMGRWILESGGGWVVAPGDVAGHVQAMREALDPAERAKRGAAAKAFAEQQFDREKNTTRIVELLEGGGPGSRCGSTVPRNR